MHEVTELRNKLTEFRVTVSLSKISKDEIGEMRRRAPIIYGMKGRGRRSDALVRSKANGNSPRVQSIKCTAARGIPCK